MEVTFDKSIKQFVWQAISKRVDDKTCPFCGVTITGKNFSGAAFINDEFRAFDSKIPCLIMVSDFLLPERE